MSYDSDCYCHEQEAFKDDDGSSCVFCEMETNARLNTLAKNLMMAGVLCESFGLGYVHDNARKNFTPGWAL